MAVSFYHINESSKLDFKNKGTKHKLMFWNICVGLCHDVDIQTVQSMTS